MLAEIKLAETLDRALCKIVTPEARDGARAFIAGQEAIGNNATQAAIFAAETGDVRAVAAIISEGGVRRPFGKGLMLAACEIKADRSDGLTGRSFDPITDRHRSAAAEEAIELKSAIDRLNV